MNMVRTSLLAAAAGVLISPALMAADIASDSASRTYSNELLSTAAATDIVAGDTLAIILEAEYAVDDVITLSFSGAALDDTTLPTSVTVVEGAISGITLGLLSGTSDTAIYRVTEIVPGTATTTVDLSVEIAGADVLEFDAQAVDAANTVTVSFEAETGNGLPLDTSGGDDRSIDYIETDDQYSLDVDEDFDQVVDVNQDRLGFENMDCCDQAQITLNSAAFSGGTADEIDFDIVWTGDFSWIIDTDENTADIQPLPGVVFSNCTDNLVVTATSISHTCPFGFGTTFLDLNVEANDDPELQTLPATPFTVSVTANFEGFDATAGSAVFDTSAGRWVLNGFQALVPYMPYGPNIGQVIYLVNRGPQAGDVTVDYTDQNGNQGSLGVIGNLGGTTTLSIGPAIRSALPQALQDLGRLGLTVTANVPAQDVQINSQYNASGNRAFADTETNRPITTVVLPNN